MATDNATPGESPVGGAISIPDHELFIRIGVGSYGEVWLARNVMGTYRAVKIVYRKTFDSDRPYEREFSGIQRFEPISRSHESHVDILHIGRNDELGYFYYVMELADDQTSGQKIDPAHYTPRTLRTVILQRGALPFDECVGLALSMVGALQNLHSHRLIHRDVKPSNIIFVNGLPKLADIGLVTHTEATLSYVGTEGFIPLEGPGSPQADIYSLGKVLYEASTGRDRQNFPVLPTLLRGAPEEERLLELNAITLKACENDLRRRYESAEKMHADLVLLQSGKSITRLRWMERRLAIVRRISLIAASIAVLAGLAYVYQARQTRLVKKLADDNLALAEMNRTRLVRWDLGSGARRMDDGDLLGALPWFAEALKHDARSADREEIHRLRLAAVMGQAPRLIGSRVHGLTPVDNSPDDYGIEFSADRQVVAISSRNGSVRLLDVSQEDEPMTTLSPGGLVWHTAFSPDGLRVITSNGDGTAQLWNARTGKRLFPSIEAGFAVKYSVFSPDGRRVVVAGYDPNAKVGLARMWDAVTGKPLGRLMKHKPSAVWKAIFSPDGAYIVTASGSRENVDQGEARVWDGLSGEATTPPLAHNYPVWSVSFSPDSRYIVTASGNTEIKAGEGRIWEVKTGQPVGPPLKHDDGLFHASFSPSGSRVLTVSGERVRVWNVAMTAGGLSQSAPLDIIAPAGQAFSGASFSPDGRFVMTVTRDAVIIWDGVSGKQIAPAFRHSDGIVRAEFSVDGTKVFAVTESTVHSWDLVFAANSSPTFWHNGPSSFSPDGRRIVTAGAGGNARIWDAATGGSAIRTIKHDLAVFDAEFSADGRRIVTAGYDSAQVWNAETGEALGAAFSHTDRVTRALFSPDGRFVLTVSNDHSARVWEATTGKPISPSLHHKGEIWWAQFSPDSQKVVTASADKTACVWDALTGRPVLQPLKHDEVVTSAAFSPDSRHVVTASLGRTQIWDATTGERMGAPFKHPGHVMSAAFSPDGHCIATGSSDANARIWDVASGIQICPPMRHDGSLVLVMFSRDGRLLLSSSRDGTIRVWDARTGDPVTAPIRQVNVFGGTGFGPDGRTILLCNTPESTQVWKLAPDRRRMEDLIALAQLLSARKVDESGALVSVESASWREMWERLNAKGPAFGAASKQELLAWHQLQAESCIGRGSWQALLFHTSKTIALESDGSRNWSAHGRAYHKLLEFHRAALDYEKAIQLGEEHHGVWVSLGGAKLAVADVAGYRRLCAAMLERFSEDRNLETASAVARFCAQIPDAVPNFDRVLRLAERAATKGGAIPALYLNLGAVQWRAGQYEQAIENFKKGAAKADKVDVDGCYPWLAMAHHHLGHAAEARESLNKATAALEEAFAGDKASAEMPRVTQVSLLYLCHEAESLLNGRGFVPLTPEALRTAWAKLQAKFGGDYTRLSPEAIAWHEREAQEDEAAGRWFAARFHLDWLLDALPNDPTMRNRLELVENELTRLPEVPTTEYVEPNVTNSVPARDPLAPRNLIDLSGFYNAALTESWQSGHQCDLSSLPAGVQTFAGTQFDVRGVIQLYGKIKRGPKYPKIVAGIRVGLKCQQLHFLHASGFASVEDGTEVGKCIIHFLDGEKLEMPIVHGWDVRDWWVQKNEPEESKRSVVAWRGTNPYSASRQTTIRLFKSTWENPRPTVEIQSIDYISSETACAPFLIAITAGDEATLPNGHAAPEAEMKKLPEPAATTDHAESNVTDGIPPRDRQATPNLLDLTCFYNAALTGPWQGSAGNDLSTLPSGVQTFAGTQFDVRGIIQLFGTAKRGPRFPKAVSGIPIGLKSPRLHFLHASTFAILPDGTRIGKYVIRFVDNEKREVPIVYGVDVRDWWTGQNEPDANTGPVLAWQGTNPYAASRNTEIRLFKSTWENPQPDAEIKSIDCISSESGVAPFVVAITAE